MNTPYLVVPTVLMEVLREKDMLDKDGRLTEEFFEDYPYIPRETVFVENKPISNS